MRLTMTPQTDEPDRINRADELAQTLADDIINGRIYPGIKLDEQSLAERFSVSRTPVREALGQLAAMGLVEKIPHRGVVVLRITEERLREMFEVMSELEASCTRFAAVRMSTAERHELEDLHRSAATLVQNGDHEGYKAINDVFHTMLYAGAHNSFLVETAQATKKRVNPFRLAQFNTLGRLADSYAEHASVVKAILSGDGDGAARAMRSHMSTVREAFSELVAHSDDKTKTDF